MPSFKLIKPYGHRYKDADNSLQHHAQHKQKQICNKPCLQRRGPSRSVSRKKHTAAKTSQSTLITPPEDQHQGNSGSAQISSLAAEGPCPLALDRRASHRQTRVCSPLNKENYCPRDSHRMLDLAGLLAATSTQMQQQLRQEQPRGKGKTWGQPSNTEVQGSRARAGGAPAQQPYQLQQQPTDPSKRATLTSYRRPQTAPPGRVRCRDAAAVQSDGFWTFARDGGRGWEARASAVPPGR
jgi:hypothetical protein